MFRTFVIPVIAMSTLLVAAPQPQSFRRPLVFEPNRGQAPAEVEWIARGPGYQLLLTADGMAIRLMDRPGVAAPLGQSAAASRNPISFPSPVPSAASPGVGYTTLKMKLSGSRPWTMLTGLEPTGGVSNYYPGSDSKRWHTGIPHYARLVVGGVYPGIDLVLYSHGTDFEYDFAVAPGADPNQIRLAFEGADGLHVDESGDLLLNTANGSQMRHIRPKVYESVGKQRIEIAGAYQILDGTHAAFTLAAHDRRHALVIDPTVSFTIFLAGSNMDTATAVAVDSSGNSYVLGTTNSGDFPIVNGMYPSSKQWPATFITKLSPSGSILFSTFSTGQVYLGTGVSP